MKKTLQINIGGFFFTIEEEAYHKLNHYLSALKTYFSNYESCDEIVQDIEARIAEKFFEKHQSAGIIENDDVDRIIASMGSVSDFEALKEEEDLHSAPKAAEPAYQTEPPLISGLYRDGRRKALGGVLAGIAHKYKFDVVWARMVFLVFTLGLIGEGVGPALILVYLICWVVMPVRNDLEDNPSVRKFYRNPDDKVIGGVASGLASFLRMDVKIVRIIFVVSGFMVIGIILYMLLWIVAPTAHSVTQKLQLEGQPVTIENIEKSVRIKEGEQPVKTESALSKILLFPFRLIGLLFSFLGRLVRPFGTLLKILAGVLLIFMGISIAFSALVGLGAFFGLLNSYQWIHTGNLELNRIISEIPPLGGVFAFFTIFIPGLAFIFAGTMLIIGKAIGNRNFWLTLLLLWFTGIVGTVSIGTKYSLNFAHRATVQTEQSFSLPKDEVLTFDVKDPEAYGGGIRPDFSITGTNMDQVYIVKTAKSNGPSAREAQNFARNVSYGITQNGSMLVFDNNFTIKDNDPFRDQSVRLEIEIPHGTKFRFTKRYLDALGLPWIIRDGGFNYDYSGNNTFVINENNKVQCLDCPESDPYENVERDFDNEAFGGDFENWETRNHNKVIRPGVFDKVKIDQKFRVLLVKGDSTSVTLYANQERNIHETRVRVINGTLTVDYEDPFKKYDEETLVLITTPNISEVAIENEATLKMYGFENISRAGISVSENSKAAIQLNARSLTLNIDEKSNVLLMGQIDELKASISDQSILKAQQAKITSAAISASASSVAELGKVKNKTLKAEKDSIIKDEDN
ncbi:MAG: PspC domain-containing protein [Leadbetterella sp.]|nr:PspC domain-containing protein [Leadbetterella sp.]